MKPRAVYGGSGLRGSQWPLDLLRMLDRMAFEGSFIVLRPHTTEGQVPTRGQVPSLAGAVVFHIKPCAARTRPQQLADAQQRSPQLADQFGTFAGVPQQLPWLKHCHSDEGSVQVVGT